MKKDSFNFYFSKLDFFYLLSTYHLIVLAKNPSTMVNKNGKARVSALGGKHTGSPHPGRGSPCLLVGALSDQRSPLPLGVSWVFDPEWVGNAQMLRRFQCFFLPFFFIFGNDCIGFVLYTTDTVYYINAFLDVKLTLHSWDKYLLV